VINIEKILQKTEEIIKNADALEEFVEDRLSQLKEEKKKSFRKNGGIILDEKSRYAVIGDIHGDLETLKNILKKVSETIQTDYIVFLGDYVDRGPKQIEAIVTVLLLKDLYSEKTIILRGNHEPLPELTPFPHDFPLQLLRRYGQRGKKLYQGFLSLFEELPYVLIIKDEAIMLHGGPPTDLNKAENIEHYFALDRETPPFPLLEEVLWNDPSEDIEYRAPSPRGAGWLFGKKVTESALKIANAKVIIRGHEPADKGYKLNHNGKVLTLFSRKGPPYNNQNAAFLSVNLEDEEWNKKIEDYIIQI